MPGLISLLARQELRQEGSAFWNSGDKLCKGVQGMSDIK